MTCLYLAEFARTITSFDEQPLSISYVTGRRRRRYTPDFRFAWADGQEWFVEVKPAGKLATPENIERFAAIASYFESTGARFVALTEEHIFQPGRSQLVPYLLHLRPPEPVPSVAAYRHWQGADQLSFAEAAKILGSPRSVLEALAFRDLVCDLHQPLTAKTLIRPFAEADDDALFV
ncbi:MAG: TnsA endonuclease N-terminal domain-containing protein [Cupriavidus sp.]|nr:TnsA endonuclease N-terminal domain-containing protein [Cupriavidus sp.]